MCVISGEVSSVSNTNIFCAEVSPKLQLTVYSNKVDLPSQMSFLESKPVPISSFLEEETLSSSPPAAMILPVPKLSNTDDDSIEMVDISKLSKPVKEFDMFGRLSYTEKKNNIFFEELRACCPKQSRSRSYSAKGIEGTFSTNSSLEVKRCGSYRYSIVPRFEDFHRISSIFNVDPSCLNYLGRFYKVNFAFLVCILDESAEYEPIAYTHPYNGKNMFIPTRHYHTHPHISSNDDDDTTAEDWDHSIYSISGSRDQLRVTDDSNCASKVQVESIKSIRKPQFENFKFNKNIRWDHLIRREIHGRFQNGDLIVSSA